MIHVNIICMCEYTILANKNVHVFRKQRNNYDSYVRLEDCYNYILN